jgi:uncharacterized coiled-coil protein SlyX
VLAAAATNADLAIIIGAALAFMGGLTGLYFQQKNRRNDKGDKAVIADSTSRSADIATALASWKDLLAATNLAHQQQIANMGTQVASLTTRLDELGRQIREYEHDIVPRLEGTITQQQTTISGLLQTITEQQETISTLTTRVDDLEKLLNKEKERE